MTTSVLCSTSWLKILPISSVCCVLFTGVVVKAGPGGGGGGASSVAEREVARRMQRVSDAQAAVIKGDELYAQGDFEGARNEYKSALDLIPDAPFTADMRAQARSRYCDASVRLAKQRAQNGRYAEARSLLKDVLDQCPGHAAAVTLSAQLDDPERYNPALTPEHVKNVADVTRAIEMGKSSKDLGNYDDANKYFQDALRIDPYNTTARRDMEKVEQEKSVYFEAARDHTRIKMLNMVNQGWEDKVPTPSIESDPSKIYGTVTDASRYYMEKMKKIIFPVVQFQGASIEEAIEFLRIKSKDLDTATTDPSKKGVNLIIRPGTAPSTAQITLDLHEVPMIEALRYITELAGMKYKVEPFAVVVVPPTDTNTEQFTRTFKVPPDFLSMGDTGGGGGGAPAAPDPFAAPVPAGGKGAAAPVAAATPVLAPRATAKDILTSAGIIFPEGATASFVAATSQLVVKNTQPNLDAIEAFVDGLIKKIPQQIYITTKFVEVQQDNTDELGFDWLMGQFALPGTGGRIFGSGGTDGTAANTTPSTAPGTFPFLLPGTQTPVGGLPVTSGLRSGTAAITPDSIDGLIQQNNSGSTSTPTPTKAPGVFAISGIFTNPQFQLVMRALSQKTGTDLMSAPSVTTRSGQRASVEVVREFRYPTEFNPPQIPTNFGTGLQVGGVGGSSTGAFPVTPTTPTAFEMRPVGVRLEVDPVLGPDGYTIDLNLSPEVTEFDGFINYGSPISTSGVDALGNPTSVVLTPNKIVQPVFETRKVTTAVTIWDGQTVVLGGLIREDVQETDDKVPILGDIPWIGRLFQDKASEHLKRNLMIFVTAKLVDPSGTPIRDLNPHASAAAATAASGTPLLPPP